MILCAICKVSYTKTTLKLLPCLHTLCEPCLKELLSKYDDILPCPRCDIKIKIPSSGLSGFKTITSESSVCSVEHYSKCDCMTDTRNEQRGQSNLHMNGIVNGELTDFETLAHNKQSIETNSGVGREYCCVCDTMVCALCLCDHENHSVLPIREFARLKKNFISEMTDTLQTKSKNSEDLLSIIECVSGELEQSIESIKCDISKRAHELCDIITKKKDTLLKSIDSIIDKHKTYYNDFKIAIQDSAELVNESIEFTKTVLDGVAGVSLLHYHDEISSRLSHLVQETKDSLKILNVKLDIPDKGKTEVFVDKLYGSLIQGDTVCGDADLLATFKTDLNWPCGVVVSRTNEYMVCGKSGAFEQDGKLLCYDRHGKESFSYTLPNKNVPNGVCLLDNNDIYMSTFDGNIVRLTNEGIVEADWEFRAAGKNSIAQYDNQIFVTSCDESCIKVVDQSGKHVRTITPFATEAQTKLKPSLIDISHSGLVAITSFQDNAIYFLDGDGSVVSEYGDATRIQCPSAIQFDDFENLLVADFTADCVHLVSKSGQYLGRLLDKSHQVACPNALTFDNEGHLLIGQYGGDILVFRYISLSKQM